MVVRHTAQPDLVWRPERDRWSHELTDRALERLLAAARDAGHAVTSEAELLALPDLDFVRAIWASCWARTTWRPTTARWPSSCGWRRNSGSSAAR